ncbi:hypothetical protein ACH4U5_39530 [Streptomyces sp. NPDC020858]|uniref:hypothetical protein n=1 Tax=Streptomyces sp. NPDC020858 TaxID=3365097 RepID=UPI0037931C93
MDEAGPALEPAWADRLPDGTPGVLTGDADTDRGARRLGRTRAGGLVGHLPVPLDADTQMVLASALALRLTWIQST